MKIRIISMIALLGLTVACSSRSIPPSSMTGISGVYEFVVTSNVTGGVTLIGAKLSANGAQSGASGPSEVQILTLEKKNWYPNGVCAGSSPGQNSMAASLSGSNISLTFNQGGNTLPGQGSLTGSTVTGNYSVTGSNCPDLLGTLYPVYVPPGSDSGGIVGNQVPPLAGAFYGTLNLPSGNDNVGLTLSEDSSGTLTVSAVLAGPVDNGTFTFTGSAVGNIMFVSGTVNGQALSFFGYFDRAGAYTGMPNSMIVFNYSTLSKIGLLIRQ